MTTPTFPSEGAELEMALSIAAIVAWLIVMVRYRHTLWLHRRSASTLLILLMVWVTLGALLVRAMRDMGWVTFEVAVLSAAVVRGMMLIVGLAFVFMRSTTSETSRYNDTHDVPDRTRRLSGLRRRRRNGRRNPDADQ